MSNRKAFTILELLVVVAIIAILAIIAIPNFIGRIDEAKEAQNLAEINAVHKAIAIYYTENGVYPTLQGKDGTLLQAQPLEGAPHNIDFSSLVPNYLASLPHFSYWWVDYKGDVYHTQNAIGTLSGNVFTPTEGYTYELYKTAGTKQVLSAPYTLLAGEYVLGKDDAGVDLPKVGLGFKNAKVHPESGEGIASVTLDKASLSLLTSSTGTLVPSIVPSDAPNKEVTWSSSNTGVATVNSSGLVTAVSAGTAVITVTAVDGGLSASCTVTVSAPIVYTFTTAGNSGASGPNLTQLNTAYAGTSLAGSVTVSSGIQYWTVPTTGVYRIETYGAQGAGPNGGNGAIMKGDFSLTAGNQLKILVGQQGTATSYGGGGGGGTFVFNVHTSSLLIVSGGGGARGFTVYNGAPTPNRDATVTQTANAGGAGSGGAGGVAGVAGGGGGGGASVNGTGGGGGGGYSGNGIAAAAVKGSSVGGTSFTAGGVGGLGDSSVGGFGGGSGTGGNGYGGGAGGGYSGGGGGASWHNTTCLTGDGGGGGSYNIGVNQDNSVGNIGAGKVIITYIGQ